MKRKLLLGLCFIGGILMMPISIQDYKKMRKSRETQVDSNVIAIDAEYEPKKGRV